MFNVNFSEQHQGALEENVHRACTMFLPRAGIRNVKNFVSLSCERFCYFDASGVADVFFWSEFK